MAIISAGLYCSPQGDPMARLSTVPDHQRRDQHPILDASQQCKRRCLLSDGSVFPDSSLWTILNRVTLDDRFSKNPIAEDQSFLNKLRGQLESAPGAVPSKIRQGFFNVLQRIRSLVLLLVLLLLIARA